MFVAFRLKPDRDDDLIAWINTLGEDERSAGIRQALRGNVTRQESFTAPKIKPKEVTPRADAPGNIEKNLDSWF